MEPNRIRFGNPHAREHCIRREYGDVHGDVRSVPDYLTMSACKLLASSQSTSWNLHSPDLLRSTPTHGMVRSCTPNCNVCDDEKCQTCTDFENALARHASPARLERLCMQRAIFFNAGSYISKKLKRCYIYV